jgi:hypothetical protein
MDEEKKKQSNRESVKKYREKIKNDPQKLEEAKNKWRERNKKRIEDIKSDPKRYEEYLENEKQRSQQKRDIDKNDPNKREARNKYYREYRKNNKEKIKPRDSEEWKIINLTRRYGITVEYFNLLLEQQNNLCAICFKQPKKLHIDHCHKSGKVRALLCSKCNTSLGLLNEDVQIFNNAIQYLEKHKGLKHEFGTSMPVAQ